MISPTSRPRRAFLFAGGTLTGALLLGWLAAPVRSRLGRPSLLATREGELALNGWLALATDGGATVVVPRAEMGQGVHTALPMLVAEELELPLARVRIAAAPAMASIYGNIAMLEAGLPFHPADDGVVARLARRGIARFGREARVIATGGSSSVADAWEVMRLAGATAREALRAAGAKALGAKPADCRCVAGEVVAGDRRITYAELVRREPGLAALAPTDVPLKAPKDWTLIGRPAPRLDTPAKVTGAAIYGIDARPEGLVHAAVKFCPVIGGSVRRVEPDAVSGLPGVLRVAVLPPERGATGGVAVIAKTGWHAREALKKLPVEWHEGANAGFDSDAHRLELEQAVRTRHGFALAAAGGAASAFASAGRRLEAWYHAPYLAHATMEPMNATAQLRDGRCTIWASTQVPAFARAAAAAALGLPADAITLHELLLGGGFGRRLEVDVIAQAARLARETGGRPVQLAWSRDEDLAHDFYRPMQVARMNGALDASGALSVLASHTAGDAITPQWLARNAPWLVATPPDKTQVEGLFDVPYAVPHRRMEHIQVPSPVPVGYWRSVGHSMNAFFMESFVDEMAALAGADPLAFRLRLLAQSPRHRAVLEAAARKAGWGSPMPPGRARGLALAESFGSVVAEVAEVSLAGGAPRVHRVVAAIDCGVPVNPRIIAQQLHSSVVFGLGAALFGEITIKGGQVQQRSFDDYRMPKLADMPAIETVILPSAAAPTGVGEPGVPPLAPAVANALFALTGQRLRRLPLRPA